MVNLPTISSGLAAAENALGSIPKVQGKTLNWLMQPTAKTANWFAFCKATIIKIAPMSLPGDAKRYLGRYHMRRMRIAFGGLHEFV
jgi:hypothetical protein